MIHSQVVDVPTCILLLTYDAGMQLKAHALGLKYLETHLLQRLLLPGGMTADEEHQVLQRMLTSLPPGIHLPPSNAAPVDPFSTPAPRAGGQAIAPTVHFGDSAAGLPIPPPPSLSPGQALELALALPDGGALGSALRPAVTLALQATFGPGWRELIDSRYQATYPWNGHQLIAMIEGKFQQYFEHFILSRPRKRELEQLAKDMGPRNRGKQPENCCPWPGERGTRPKRCSGACAAGTGPGRCDRGRGPGSAAGLGGPTEPNGRPGGPRVRAAAAGPHVGPRGPGTPGKHLGCGGQRHGQKAQTTPFGAQVTSAECIEALDRGRQALRALSIEAGLGGRLPTGHVP